jgi:hypothetical protein
MRWPFLLTAALALAGLARAEIEVDADFPGGNIVVLKVDGDVVQLKQDLRDTQGDWFYWYFRVRNAAAGRTVKFQFMASDVIGNLGPAVSTDEGLTWTWLGRGTVKDRAFEYRVADDGEVRFAMAIPYVESDLHRFLKRIGDGGVKVERLCGTKEGRPVEKLRFGKLDGDPKYRVLLTARHHACESIASFELEGVIEAVLGEEKWLRENVEFLAVPFMDKDGVEDGDQGKNRKPHDHNRDYMGESIHPSVAALRKLAPQWGAGKIRIALDLHCPALKTDYIHFVGGPDEENWNRATHLADILERTQTGPLKYRVKDNVPHGVSWNTLAEPRMNSRWAVGLEGVRVATTIELPYADVRKTPVTADSARAFGKDVARAIRLYLQDQ